MEGVTLESLLTGNQSHQIIDLLRKHVKDDKVPVLVDQGDIHMSSNFPDQEFSSSCSKKLSARNIRARGSLQRSSSLSADVKSTDSSLSVSFGGNLEAVINLDFQFRGEVGALPHNSAPSSFTFCFHLTS